MGLRPRLRLRQDQRRLHVADRADRRRWSREGRSPHELLADIQAYAARRGAVVHRAVLGHALRRARRWHRARATRLTAIVLRRYQVTPLVRPPADRRSRWRSRDRIAPG